MKSSSTSGCVYELQTLEDQLEAALASLTLSITDSPKTTTKHVQSSHEEPTQRSSDSSACSSGVGEELANEPFHLFPMPNNPFHNDSIASRTADDGDSAFSDAESTDKILSANPNDNVMTSFDLGFFSSLFLFVQLLYRSMAPIDTFIAPSSHSQASKILVRTYNDDGSTKSIFIDDTMTIRDVLFLLIHKNHREPHMDYVLVEILPDLHMGKSQLERRFSSQTNNRLAFRTNFRRSSKIVRSHSHVANGLDEPIEFQSTNGKIHSVSNSRRTERASRHARHRRNDLFQREIAKILEKILLRSSFIRPLFRSEGQNQSKILFSLVSSLRHSLCRKSWSVWRSSRTSNSSWVSTGRRNSNRRRSFVSLWKYVNLSSVELRKTNVFYSCLASVDPEEEFEIHQIHVRWKQRRIRSLDHQHSRGQSESKTSLPLDLLRLFRP